MKLLIKKLFVKYKPMTLNPINKKNRCKSYKNLKIHIYLKILFRVIQAVLHHL